MCGCQNNTYIICMCIYQLTLLSLFAATTTRTRGDVSQNSPHEIKGDTGCRSRDPLSTMHQHTPMNESCGDEPNDRIGVFQQIGRRVVKHWYSFVDNPFGFGKVIGYSRLYTCTHTHTHKEDNQQKATRRIKGGRAMREKQTSPFGEKARVADTLLPASFGGVTLRM